MEPREGDTDDLPQYRINLSGSEPQPSEINGEENMNGAHDAVDEWIQMVGGFGKMQWLLHLIYFYINYIIFSN